MKEPTEAQIKEFWEYFIPERIDANRIVQGLPDIPIDLNNLFKYAVPKIHHGLGITVIIYSGGGDTVGYPVVELRKCGKRVIPLEMDNKDPALALFWAIWEVLKER